MRTMQLSSLPSVRRHGAPRPAISATARTSVVANSSVILRQNFTGWTGSYFRINESDAKNKLWRQPSGAGAEDVKTFRGIFRDRGGKPGERGRMLVGHKQCKIEINEGIAGLRPLGNRKGSGVGMKVELEKKVDEATLTYRFKFSPKYDWTEGGKLPGLSSALFPDGGTKRGQVKGWSNRLMWRLNADQIGKGTKEARMISYRYYPGEGGYQDQVPWNRPASQGGGRLKIEADKWYRITNYIKLNDVGKRNGKQVAWIQEEDNNEKPRGPLMKVLDEDNYLYRTSNAADQKIGGLHWHIYHGGRNDSDSQPSKNQHILLDNVVIRKGRHSP